MSLVQRRLKLGPARLGCLRSCPLRAGTRHSRRQVPCATLSRGAGVEPFPVVWERYVAAAVGAIGDPSKPDWPSPAILKYDAMSFSEFLRRQGASEESLALLRLGTSDLLGDGSDTVSALNQLREQVHRRLHKQAFAIRGGNDRLPEAFAERLRHKIRYGAPVVEIHWKPTGAEVVFRQGGLQKEIKAETLKPVCRSTAWTGRADRTSLAGNRE